VGGPVADAGPEAVVVRFAGDSGDGMQLTGGQFTLSTALAGNDLATFPDFPAEIRAPQGTLFGVSAFQINFGSTEIETAGDAPDVLIAMNPAALKTNVEALKPGGLIIVDTGEFTKRNLEKAKYATSPLDDASLAKWQVLAFDISALTLESVKPFGLGNKEALRCKNMWTLGLALWMFDRDRGPLIAWLRQKFAKSPMLAEANIAALNAGHAYGETAELSGPLKQFHLAPVETEAAQKRSAWGWSPGRSLPASRCSSAVIRSPPRARSSITSRGSRSTASPPSRPRTRSPRSAPRSGPLTPASLASPHRPDRASR
jgi:2-oxoglutarate ferredoxin oxidoreductase subunit alpha